ncbi:MAG: hypothetical protein JW808_07235 [Victivallales bacterium]|nr:hypothetical protein [Victivallales bacterium]
MLASCASVPEIHYDAFDVKPDALEIFDSFDKVRARRLTLCQSAVLEFKGQASSAIGLCSYDSGLGYIALSLISPTGVKLLEFVELNRKRRFVFVMPELAPGEEAAERIADDARRIYFHPEGKPTYYGITARYVSLVFDEGEFRTELRFGIDPGTGETVLREKRILLGDRLESLVFYLDYSDYDGLLYPGRIRYENFSHGYVLSLKNLEVVKGVELPKE